MKARSLILPHVQLPITMLGMPPLLAFGLFCLGLGLMAFGMLAGWVTIGFVSAIIIPGTLAAWVQIRTRRDPHFLTGGAIRRAFWKGRHHRVFLAGSGTPLSIRQEDDR